MTGWVGVGGGDFFSFSVRLGAVMWRELRLGGKEKEKQTPEQSDALLFASAITQRYVPGVPRSATGRCATATAPSRPLGRIGDTAAAAAILRSWRGECRSSSRRGWASPTPCVLPTAEMPAGWLRGKTAARPLIPLRRVPSLHSQADWPSCPHTSTGFYSWGGQRQGIWRGFGRAPGYFWRGAASPHPARTPFHSSKRREAAPGWRSPTSAPPTAGGRVLTTQSFACDDLSSSTSPLPPRLRPLPSLRVLDRAACALSVAPTPQFGVV